MPASNTATARRCKFCRGALVWASGSGEEGSERAGNAIERDTFACTGCDREYRHVVHESFSGDSHWWGMRRRGETAWTDLEEKRWPVHAR